MRIYKRVNNYAARIPGKHPKSLPTTLRPRLINTITGQPPPPHPHRPPINLENHISTSHPIKKMITNQPAPEHQLLGAQILYQKLERDIDQLTQQ